MSVDMHILSVHLEQIVAEHGNVQETLQHGISIARVSNVRESVRSIVLLVGPPLLADPTISDSVLAFRGIRL